MRLSKRDSTPSFDEMPTPEMAFGQTLSEPRSIGVPQHKTQPEAVIGAKITLKGELSGTEDILIQGRVEGNIDLVGCHLITGEQGSIEANIKAQSITIEGSVAGDVEAQEIIVVKSGSKVNGNLKAERVNLEDGAKFRGGIEMLGDE